jgi:cell wall-associated NlpC family hydrolase
LAAYSFVGKVNYFWGGKSIVIGCPNRWGTLTKVAGEDSPTTETVRPFGLDCSGYVTWIFVNAAGTARL